MVAIAGKEVPTGDAVLIGTGALSLIFFFFPWYGFSAGGISVSAKANDVGFFAWFPALLLVLVGVAAAAKVFAGFKLPAIPQAGPAFVLLAVSGLATVLLVLKFLIDHNLASGTILGDDIKVTPRVGFYLTILVGLAQTAYGFLAFKASGEAVPDFKNLGGSTGRSTGSTPPAAPPSAPPPPATPPTGGYAPPPAPPAPPAPPTGGTPPPSGGGYPPPTT